MIAAEVDAEGIVLNTIVLDELIEGYVACPEWVGIGMHIDTPAPESWTTNIDDPAEKLRQFLIDNPDVAALTVGINLDTPAVE